MYDFPAAEARRYLGRRTCVTMIGCWVWSGALTDGYGRLRRRGQMMLAHRLAYEAFVGEVPEGLVLDHLCRNRACCNPDHVEPVTHAENLLHGIGATATNAAKVTCHRGHPFTKANTYRRPGTGWRECRACHRDQMADARNAA